MFEVLDRFFSDPDRRFTAQRAYRKLFQNKDNFATFWAEFQRLTIELDYSEETLIDDLRHTRMQTARQTQALFMPWHKSAY
jgi:branched-subunit amino acid aminotransferase/4-amino-4-deoxychorismate lyase